MMACCKKCIIKEDIDSPIALPISSNIEGCGHTIRVKESARTAISINSSSNPISIRNLCVVKYFAPGEINSNYAIRVENSSNIFFDNCEFHGRLFFRNNTCSDDPNRVSRNITIKNSKLYCDLTVCPQGWEYGQDHMVFQSIKGVRIENCQFVSKNVNRVIKTTAYFKDKNYDHPQNCTDGFIFKNNSVQAESLMGKQLWDMYCGTTNVLIEGNTFYARGFTRFVEDKAYQPKYIGDSLIKSLIAIKNNKVYINGASLFLFRTHPICDAFEVVNNEFYMSGDNVSKNTSYTRGVGVNLHGYRSCLIKKNLFVFSDSAVGLPFAAVRFHCCNTVISHNKIKDTSGILFCTGQSEDGSTCVSQIGQFEYVGNKVSYTSSFQGKFCEIHLANTDAKSVKLKFSNANHNKLSLSLGGNTAVETLKVSAPYDLSDMLSKINATGKVSFSNVIVKRRFF